MVWPGTLGGHPARSALVRPMLFPVAPSGSPQPTTTSSTSSNTTFARSNAFAIAWPASVAPYVRLNAPRNARPIGVRAAETIAASTTGGLRTGCGDAGIPHRAAAIRREAVAVHVRDIDVAGTQRGAR